MTFAVYADLVPGENPWRTAWSILGMFVAIGTGISMVWRMSHSWLVFLINAGIALILPLDPFGTLVALTWVMETASARRLGIALALAALVTAVTLARDAFRDPPGVIAVSTDSATGQLHLLPGFGYAIIGAVILLIAVGVGTIRRSRESARVAQGDARALAQVSTQLRGELNRQEERALIAREMHDTVAHHLSLVSLHAAALEVTSHDPNVPESARAMRSSAHQALEEMRGLITSLRDSSDGGYTGSAPSLSRLPQLLSDAQSAGASIESSLWVSDGDSAAPVLTRAVYRIVQEALTNAIKHAPSSPVRVVVRADPRTGVEIFVANWARESANTWGSYADRRSGSALSSSGAGAGLQGMRERATALGGTLTAAPDGQAWVVRCWMPWRGLH